MFKGFTIYDHGGHLGHVSKMIFTEFMFPFPKNKKKKAPHKIQL